MMRARNPLLVLVWSIGLFVAMQVSQYLGVLMASIFSGAEFGQVIDGEFKNHLTILGQGLTALVVGIPVALLITRYLWRRPWDWLRLTFNARLLGFGLLLGLLMPVAIVLVLSLTAVVTFTSRLNMLSAGEGISIVIGTFGLMLFVGVVEEIVFRGMMIREWALKWNWPAAGITGGLVFALAHVLTNLEKLTVPEMLWLTLAGTVVTLLFLAMYLRAKSLWLPIGFHAAWNFCLTAVLGTTMSAKKSAFSLCETELSGGFLLTGGNFGLETSVVTVLVSAIVAVLFIGWLSRKKAALLESKPVEEPQQTDQAGQDSSAAPRE